jgi:hypothetical protein
MADTATLPDLPAHLDEDETAWIARAITAVALVHEMHLRGECS